MYIPDYVKEELQNEYIFNDSYKIEAADYGVPQFRERAIMLLVRKDLNKKWIFPEKTGAVTLEEAIGHLPSVDPEIYDVPYEQMIALFPEYEEKKKKARRGLRPRLAFFFAA